MTSRYPFWLRTTSVLQIITASVHAMSFFRGAPENPTEKQLNDLLASYRPFPEAHFHPSMADIFTGLSASFSLLYLLGGMTTLYLLQKNLSPETWKGLTSIYLLIFGVSFLLMLVFAFLAPIIFTGVVFIGFCFAYATNHIHRIRLPKE